MKRVLEHAQAINLSPERKILHILSQDFKVDEKDGLKDPIGLSGHRLEAKVHLVTVSRNIEKDLTTCMDHCGIEIDGFILEPLASSYSILDTNEKELGIVLVDIGGGTSDIIAYHNNTILHTGAIPLGGKIITKDIAFGLQTSLEQSEKIKCKNGIAKVALSDEEIEINIEGTNGRNDKNINQKDLSLIIEPRMKEIFHLVKNEISKANHTDYTFGIVLTGGGSKLKNIQELAEEIFNMPIRIGKPNLINGIESIINDPRYATTIGIVNYASSDKKTISELINTNNKPKNIFEILKIKLDNLLNLINFK